MGHLDDKVKVICEDSSCQVLMRCWEFNNEDTFKGYISGRVKNRLQDVEGAEELVSCYETVTSAGFVDDRLKDIFSQSLSLEPWRVGEALAECFLEDTSDVRFPWNGVRDQKVDSASLPGADLVGLKGNGPEVRFLFGEVKTSGDDNHPPNVMYGRSGMTKQLENLNTKSNSRNSLVRWFAWRSKGAIWESEYRTALIVYYSSDECVCLQGVLVRDTSPDIADLRSRGVALDNKKPQDMDIELCGIYCPCDISEFPALIRGVSLS